MLRSAPINRNPASSRDYWVRAGTLAPCPHLGICSFLLRALGLWLTCEQSNSMELNPTPFSASSLQNQSGQHFGDFQAWKVFETGCEIGKKLPLLPLLHFNP